MNPFDWEMSGVAFFFFWGVGCFMFYNICKLAADDTDDSQATAQKVFAVLLLLFISIAAIAHQSGAAEDLVEAIFIAMMWNCIIITIFAIPLIGYHVVFVPLFGEIGGRSEYAEASQQSTSDTGRGSSRAGPGTSRSKDDEWEDVDFDAARDWAKWQQERRRTDDDFSYNHRSQRDQNGDQSSSDYKETDYASALRDAKAEADKCSDHQAERWAKWWDKYAARPGLDPKIKLYRELVAMLLHERAKGFRGRPDTSEPTKKEIIALIGRTAE